MEQETLQYHPRNWYVFNLRLLERRLLISLCVGNEADPVTPFVSAKRVANALGESAILIEQDDYGVSSF